MRMKIQEVILKAMAGKLKWWKAAEIIGVTDRTMRRAGGNNTKSTVIAGCEIPANGAPTRNECR
jgi:hypothetical protein